MNNIDPSANRSAFFPKSKSDAVKKSSLFTKSLQRNSTEKQKELEDLSKKDAKVNISRRVKDFARIRNAVDKAPDIDKSDRIAELKAQISGGSYNMDYEGIADKMLQNEF